MTQRPIQYFTDDYLAHCATMTPEQVCEFLESFRHLAGNHRNARRRLISLRIKEPLLAAFKEKARAHGIPYQTQIQRLMEAWLLGPR